MLSLVRLTSGVNIVLPVILPMPTVRYIEDITRWCEDVNFIFEGQNNILRTSAVSEYNIVFATRK